MLGFLTPVDHQEQVTDEAVEETKRFLNAEKDSLTLAAKKFKVDPEYISALLYIETRHGRIRGKYHVPSVFASLVSVRNKTFQANLMVEAKKRMSADSPPLKEVLKKVREKVKTKSKWAASELREAQKIYLRDPEYAHEWLGSFAGAFGIPQFLPSSFSKWAYTDRRKGKRMALPDLTDPRDAILSVGNYLSKNGWGKSRAKKEKALYHYNNSKDYVEAILTLGDRAVGRVTDKEQ
jgi:membrane-bound lytic murein transglycosylase B